MRVFVILATMTLFSQTAFADCLIPTGIVTPRKDFNPALAGNSVTEIKPSPDCSTVRIWTYVRPKDGSRVDIKDAQCNTKPVAFGSGSPGSVTSCSDYPVYASKEKVKDPSKSHAYFENGGLIVKTINLLTKTNPVGFEFQTRYVQEKDQVTSTDMAMTSNGSGGPAQSFQSIGSGMAAKPFIPPTTEGGARNPKITPPASAHQVPQ